MNFKTRPTLSFATGALLFSLSAFGQIARIQVVHNAPTAPAVDVFVGSTKLISNLEFREAFGYANAPANTELQVRIKPASASNDTSNPVFFRRYTLAENQAYVLIANGLLATNGYAANPEGRNRTFDVKVIPGKETSSATTVDFAVFHGATDVPKVDAKVQGSTATLVDDIGFGEGSGYLTSLPANVTAQIFDSTGTVPLLAYSAPLSGFAGKALLLVASGFLSPAANQNGPGFELMAVTNTGETILLPQATARVQVVHNCPVAPPVDIYVGNQKAVAGLEFRKATPYVDLPAGVNIQVRIGVASATSDTSTKVFLANYNLDGGQTYSLVANGLLSQTGYAPNPDGFNTGFDVTVLAPTREISSTSATDNNVEFSVFHGVTDAPTVDVRLAGTQTVLVNNAGFRAFSGYVSVPAANYNIDVTTADGSVIVATYLAPLTTYADSAINVMASGFLSSTNNSNGPAFALIAVTPKGNVITLPVVTSVSNAQNGRVQAYPNPASSGYFKLESETPVKTALAIAADGRLFNLSGETEGNATRFKSTDLAAGLYHIVVELQDGSTFKTKLSIQ